MLTGIFEILMQFFYLLGLLYRIKQPDLLNVRSLVAFIIKIYTYIFFFFLNFIACVIRLIFFRINNEQISLHKKCKAYQNLTVLPKTYDFFHWKQTCYI